MPAQVVLRKGRKIQWTLKGPAEALEETPGQWG